MYIIVDGGGINAELNVKGENTFNSNGGNGIYTFLDSNANLEINVKVAPPSIHVKMQLLTLEALSAKVPKWIFRELDIPVIKTRYRSAVMAPAMLFRPPAKLVLELDLMSMLMRAASRHPMSFVMFLYLHVRPKLIYVRTRMNVPFKDSLVIYNNTEYNTYGVHVSGSLLL